MGPAMTKTDYIRIEAPAASLPFDGLFPGDSQVSQMFTDQANTITQKPLNASPENLGISLQYPHPEIFIDQADTVTQNSMCAFFDSIKHPFTPDSEMFTDQAYAITQNPFNTTFGNIKNASVQDFRMFTDQAHTCTQKPLDLFNAGNIEQDYVDTVNNNF